MSHCKNSRIIRLFLQCKDNMIFLNRANKWLILCGFIQFSLLPEERLREIIKDVGCEAMSVPTTRLSTPRANCATLHCRGIKGLGIGLWRCRVGRWNSTRPSATVHGVYIGHSRFTRHNYRFIYLASVKLPGRPSEKHLTRAYIP